MWISWKSLHTTMAVAMLAMSLSIEVGSHSNSAHAEDVTVHRITIRETSGFEREADGFTRSSRQDLEKSDQPKLKDKRVYMENKFRPYFKKCGSASLNEGMPNGTLVTHVTAEDEDSGSAGEVFYTIVRASNSEQQFYVHNTTGEVFSNRPFDRDEPNREKIFYVTVKATDKGIPPLEAICTFNVTIEDVNDNPPRFGKPIYEISIPKDMEPNKLVMRVAATDVDFGENAQISFSLDADNKVDLDWFSLNGTTGAIHLRKKLTHPEGTTFFLQAIAKDFGKPQLHSTAPVKITVASSTTKSPSFIRQPTSPVELYENYSAFKTPIATLEAQSNIPETDLFFELVKGQTQQTNSDETFKINERGNSVDILVNKRLDYETVTHYTLTVRVKNAVNAAAETVLEINVLDVNDESPTFIAVDGGSVLENSAPRTFVLRVQATDRDGTYPNNYVKYELRDFKDKFDINANTGDITTMVQLDREEKRWYALTVVAYDGSESALTGDGKPNEVAKRFQIEVADVNDNPPYFKRSEYLADIGETDDLGTTVLELTAYDNDTDSELTYDIISGNIGNVFAIENSTGILKVNGPLDYEKLKEYKLVVEVDDGKQKARTSVHIKIININDSPPQFSNANPTEIRGITEEQVPRGPIVTVSAVDLDFDPSTNSGQMEIEYFISGSNAEFFSINKEGQLSIVKPLDRDPPNGRKDWTIFVVAQDDLNGVKLQSTLHVIIYLDDINDNAPYLDMPQPVIWNENQDPGLITKLTIKDNDEDKNGPPFTAKMADSAEDIVRTSFKVDGSPAGWYLTAMKRFDREERKQYLIPIVINDSGSPVQSATSTLTVVIGDANDNPMYDGTSNILVYNYKGSLPDTNIGRVYVEDLDDWDLPDKTFSWHPHSTPSPYFDVSAFGGFITMRKGTPPNLYSLRFHVHDNFRNEDADATVNVLVREIPEEAVRKSGSIRLSGASEEDFVTSKNGVPSKKDVLQKKIASFVGAKEENVDVFTVFNQDSRNRSVVDVRFSAHGSPYYDPVKLNGLTSEHRRKLEAAIGVKIEMFGIDECLFENATCDGSCTNRLKIQEKPYLIATNTSTFVGVDARIVADCVCLADEYLNIEGCDPTTCLHGGTCTGDRTAPCRCRDGFEGPRCEGLQASFSGTGWAWYDPLPSCRSGYLTLSVFALTHDGLILYTGPTAAPDDVSVKDFMALELREGSPVLYLDLGSGTTRLEFSDRTKSLVDEKKHEIEISWSQRSIQMRIDGCNGGQQWCQAATKPSGDHQYLNVNGPLQVGGTVTRLADLKRAFGWSAIPMEIGFSGCIQNITFNGMVYDLYAPGYYRNVTSSCDGLSLPSVIASGVGWELIVALIVIFLILIIILLSILVYRRRRSHDTLKEFHDDIRENIINYSDEGGGEGDMTGYDLSVLRMTPDGKPLIGKGDDYGKLLTDDDLRQRRATTGEVPDISQFLDDNKGRVDRDPDGLPYDDLRHYAYEGDGNSQGSLSSLASGTDDGDLNFDYLSDFGPRFKKLADMYGDHSSDSEDDESRGQLGNESWC